LLADDGSARTWYVGDALGSVRMTLDDAGTALGSVGYDPWGTPQGDLLGAFGFTGELQDGDTSVVYLRARWYNPGSGTFTTRDPFGGQAEQPGSWHQYTYAQNDPINWIDPTGHYRWKLANFQGNWGEIAHGLIEDYYMNFMGDHAVHVEYTIPGRRIPIDILNEVTGEVFEIKPVSDLYGRIYDADGIQQLSRNIQVLNIAALNGMLTGVYPVPPFLPYDWNQVAWIPGLLFPKRWEIARFPSFSLWAGRKGPGLIVYWHERTKQQRRRPLPHNYEWYIERNRGYLPEDELPSGQTAGLLEMLPDGTVIFAQRGPMQADHSWSGEIAGYGVGALAAYCAWKIGKTLLGAAVAGPFGAAAGALTP
jgi:RHS repeat-associated protein